MVGNNDEDGNPNDLARLGIYRVLRREDDGSMWWLSWDVSGIAYKARRADVAADGDSDGNSAPEIVLRVSAWQINEKAAHALSSLGRHPHVAALLGTDHTPDGRHLLAVERAAGESLAELVQRRGPLPVAEALALVRQVALGLQAASGAGLMHHPHLQPEDLRFTAATATTEEAENVLKIVGYEAAALIPPSPGRWGGEGSAGPRWLSPEEKESRPADGRSDVYKLGLVLWFLLVGESPLPQLHGGGNNHLPQAFLDRLPADVPAPVRALLARLLARAPGERPPLADELLQDIEACQAGRELPPALARPLAASAEDTSTGDTTCIPLDSIRALPETLRSQPSLPTPPAEAASTDAAKSPALDENVQFTAYRPKVVRPGKWAKLLVFAHLDERPTWLDADERAPLEEMAAQAAAILGPQHEKEFRQTTDDSRLAVPREGEVTLVPEMAGVEFNPPQRTFFWKEGVSVHNETFSLRAGAALDGQTARGRLTVYLGHLILAEISLAIRVDSQLGGAAVKEDATGRESSSARPFRKIFASYSHRDLEIVETVERHARALGDEYLRDWLHLRSGEQWDSRLRSIIEEADIFQLFWSPNAARSPFVEREWQHALSLRRETFVRPTYWQDPMPPPPEPLRPFHFHRLGGVSPADVLTQLASAEARSDAQVSPAIASPAASVPASEPAVANRSRRWPIGALALVLLTVAGVGLFFQQQRHSASRPDVRVQATPQPTLLPTPAPVPLATPQPSVAGPADFDPRRSTEKLLAEAELAEKAGARGEAAEKYAAACATAGEAFARQNTAAGRPYAEPAALQDALASFDPKFNNNPAQPPTANLFVRRANLRLALGRWNDAEEDYVQALKLMPDSADAKRGLALAKAAAAAAVKATPAQENSEKSQQPGH